MPRWMSKHSFVFGSCPWLMGIAMFPLLQIGAALLFTLGGVAMKRSDGLRLLAPSLLVYVCFGVGATLQTLAMRKAEMAVTYIMVLGLEAVASFALGAIIFGESITVAKSAAVLLIIGGIYLLNR